MECPYCKKEMEAGVIYGDRYALKWIEEDRDKGPLAYPFQKGIKLTSFLEGNGLTAYYCRDCEKMIIDVKDIKRD